MSDERRSTLRKAVTGPLDVVDSISGEIIGRIGNLSRTGMMLICHHPLRDGALYQLRFRLPNQQGIPTDVETGVHTMWTEQAATSGYQWSGVRIISISGAAAASLDHWLEARPA